MKKSFLVLFCAALAVASTGCANLSAKKSRLKPCRRHRNFYA
jgi:hypothetical protein